MSEQEWDAFGKLSKSKVKLLLKALTHKKLGAIKQIQKGELGSKKGKASIYKSAGLKVVKYGLRHIFCNTKSNTMYITFLCSIMFQNNKFTKNIYF